MRLDQLLAEPVPATTKGWPARSGGLALGEAGRQGWSLLNEDLPLPAAVLKRDVLAHNSRWMRGFLERFQVEICPHGKTTMAPQLFARQLADGASGITVATVQQLLVCRRFGVQRVLMANQLIGRQAIRTVLDELADDPAFDFTCLVDSVAGVEHLLGEARDYGATRPVQVLLEGGVAGSRTGCRSVEQALEVARAVAAAPELALVGVEGFEGVIAKPTPDESAAAVRHFVGFLVEIARACAAEDLFAPGPVYLTAGGSKWFDIGTATFNAADLGRETRTMLRSGCYLSHDSKMYAGGFERLRARMPEVDALGPGLQPALQVWAYVQSTPEPGRALATMGRRDVSFDVDLPVVEQWYRPGLHETPQDVGAGFKVVALNDQHAFLDVPGDSPLRVGDLVGFGISHPCTTFDKWQVIHVVDAEYRVTESLRTFF